MRNERVMIVENVKISKNMISTCIFIKTYSNNIIYHA